MKKALSILIVSVMILLLAACGDNSKSQQQASASTAAGGTTISEADGTIQSTVAGGSAASSAKTTAKSNSNGGNGGGNNQQTKAEETEWKPTIYKATTQPKKTFVTSALALDKKTVGSTNLSPISGSKYTLKWIDDFTGTSINTKNWTVGTDNANSSEGQANKVENVKVANGKLSISLKRENATCKSDGVTYQKKFTGGKMDSKGKQNFKYGRIEAYCKLPYGKGMWPSFWTIGDTTVGGREAWWPWGGEIDILEMFGKSNTQTLVSGGIFYYPPKDYENFDYGKSKSLSRVPNISKEVTDSNTFSDGYHLYGIEWTPLELTFYFDNQLWGSIDISGSDFSYAMHNDHMIILQYAVEGFGLVPGTTTNERRYDGREPGADAVLPQTFDVDWVKVWQK